MATTAIWDIKGWIGDVLHYADNPEKTSNPDYMEKVMETAMQDASERGLINVLEYAAADYKTEQRFFVSGVNCDHGIARQQMTMVKKQWHKEDGIVAFHGYQSFKSGEVSPELAHKIGVELAEKLWGDRFQVVVATHLNTKCIHNHFVLNSVSFADGKKYYDNKENYRLMRRTSDELCKANALSVIQNPQNKRQHYAEWQAEQQGARTWCSAIREDVDKAIIVSMTWSAFLRSLRENGYEVKTGVKHIAVRPPGKERFVRLRSLGEQYTEESIKQKILKQHVPPRPYVQETKNVLQIKVRGDFKLSKITFKGLRALYFFYLRKIREAQRQPEAPTSYALREDLRYAEQLNKQTLFLFKHKIDTMEQLSDYRQNAEAQIGRLLSERRELSNERRHTYTSPERREMINAALQKITVQLKSLRCDVRLCEAIAERAVTIAMEQEQSKNKDRYSSKHTSRGYMFEIQK